MEKIGAFVLIQTNESGTVVACNGYKTLEAAQQAMGDSLDAQTKDYQAQGYDDLNIRRCLGLYEAQVEVNSENCYSWTIKEI